LRTIGHDPTWARLVGLPESRREVANLGGA